MAALVGSLALVALATPAASGPAARPRAAPPAAPARSPYPAGATRPALRPGAGALARAHAAAGTSKKKRRSRCSTATRRRALVSFQAMQKAYYIKGSGLYAGEPFSYLWPFSQALAATVSMAFIPHLGVNLSPELHARLTGLNSYLDTDNSGAPEGTFTSTLPAFDGAVAPPAGPGGHQVLRRQRLDRPGARAAVRADALAGAAGQRRRDHGLRDGRLAGKPEARVPGRAFRSPTWPKTTNATPSRPPRRRSWPPSCTGSPTTSNTCASPKRPIRG